MLLLILFSKPLTFLADLVQSFIAIAQFGHFELDPSLFLLSPDAMTEEMKDVKLFLRNTNTCLLYTSPSPRDQRGSRMPSSA